MIIQNENGQEGTLVFNDIKAVIWDIYGTILDNGVNDPVKFKARDFDRYLLGWVEAYFPGFNLQGRQGEKGFFDRLKSVKEYNAQQSILNELQIIIREEHIRIKEYDPEIIQPEIKIEEIYKKLFLKIFKIELADKECLNLAYQMEKIVNPVSLFPGVKKALNFFKSRKINQGILSNAQFYTKILLSELLNISPLSDLFDKDITVFSYEEGIGKPDPRIYKKLLQKLEIRNLKPYQVLIIGDSFINDIQTPSLWGFRTAFFLNGSNTVQENACSKGIPEIKFSSYQQFIALFDDQISRGTKEIY